MRDQMDAEIWNAHHDQFSEYVDGLVHRAGTRLRRSLALTGEVPAQLAAGLVAVGLTFLTFAASAA
ncbi:MAG TPA: hypothetical protein VF702_00960 [Allosphingosinicella sp.]|jgi:hypothetical protein